MIPNQLMGPLPMGEPMAGGGLMQSIVPYRDLLYGQRGDSITRTNQDGSIASVTGGNPPAPQMTSMPYPISPMATGAFNQQALGLADPQASMVRNVQFSGPNYQMLEGLLAREAQQQQSQASLLDPLGLTGHNRFIDAIVDPIGILDGEFDTRRALDPLGIF